ncbi:MAG: TonB-dependent receptor [Calditrichaeota bacterium]|nr:TonB-dependent receptor [Calditrichota bacterium]
MKKSFYIAGIFLLFTITAFAQPPKGTIRGIVQDSESRDPLVGVNIVVLGTYLGASTDADGFYVIPNVNPGEYSLEVSYIGYKVIQKTGVKVLPGESITVNFEMESTSLALGQEIVIIGEKPLIEFDQTNTTRSVTSQDISNQIFEDVKTIVSSQVGIVQQDDEIHIRGGRTYEAQYLVDGISVQDPLSGTGFGLNISANAIEEVEVITGGYDAEYGQATSGIISVKTKSGSDKCEGFASYKTDNLGLFYDQPWSFNSDLYEFNLGGPELISNYFLPFLGIKVPGKMYFFTNIYVQVADDYTGSAANQLYSSISPTLDLFGNSILTPTTFASRQNNNWSGLFKLNWQMSPTRQLTFSYNRSISINQNRQSLQTNLEYVEPGPGFPYEYSQNLDIFNTYTHDNEKFSLQWKHTLNKTTFYEIQFSQYWAHLRSDWNGLHWSQYQKPLDVPRLPVQYYTPRDDSTKIRIIPGDGFYDYGNATFWHDHFIEWYTLQGDVTSHIGNIHTLKAGFESSFKEMQMLDIVDPWLEGGFGSTQDVYRVYPADGAFFVQDNIKFEGFYLNAGVRLDYWMPGKFVDRAVNDTLNLLTPTIRQDYADETYKFMGHRFKFRLMPRLAVSHPVSDNLMLFFNYGHFSKQPKPQFVYAKLSGVSSKSAYQKFGNPNLNPETSVKYELGVRSKINENNVINVTAYYTDIFDYVQTTTIRGVPRIGSAIFYINLDYARSRGIEAEFRSRMGTYFSGVLSGSYSLTTTKSSSPDIGLLVAQGSIDEEPIKESYAQWDRPWQVSFNLNFRVPNNRAPRIFGIKMFDDWNLNFRWFAMAGRRYTPAEFNYYRPEDGRPVYTLVEDQSLRYSKLGNPWHWADLSFRKFFQWSRFRYIFSIDITNLFNTNNVNIINNVTGNAYEYGDPTPISWNDPLYPDRFFPISEPFPFNPARYRKPRQIRFGFSMEF